MEIELTPELLMELGRCKSRKEQIQMLWAKKMWSREDIRAYFDCAYSVIYYATHKIPGGARTRTYPKTPLREAMERLLLADPLRPGAEIARELNVSAVMVSIVRRELGLPHLQAGRRSGYTPETLRLIEDIKRADAIGEPVYAIAERIGCKASYISKLRREAGLIK